jgi:hypothetical protein
MDPKWRGAFVGLIFIILACASALIVFLWPAPAR